MYNLIKIGLVVFNGIWYFFLLYHIWLKWKYKQHDIKFIINTSLYVIATQKYIVYTADKYLFDFWMTVCTDVHIHKPLQLFISCENIIVILLYTYNIYLSWILYCYTLIVYMMMKKSLIALSAALAGIGFIWLRRRSLLKKTVA